MNNVEFTDELVFYRTKDEKAKLEAALVAISSLCKQEARMVVSETTVRVMYQVLNAPYWRVVADHEIESVLCTLARVVQQGVHYGPYDVPGERLCTVDAGPSRSLALAEYGMEFDFSSRENAREFARSVRLSFGQDSLRVEIL